MAFRWRADDGPILWYIEFKKKKTLSDSKLSGSASAKRERERERERAYGARKTIAEKTILPRIFTFYGYMYHGVKNRIKAPCFLGCVLINVGKHAETESLIKQK